MNAAHDSSNARKYEAGGAMQRALIARFQRKLLSHLDGRAVNTVLDVGCGEGYLARAILDRFPGARYRGVDVSEGAVEAARARCPEATFEVATIETLASWTETFDVVVCSEVLEHLSDPHAALKILAARCAKTLVVSVPNEPLFWLANLARGKYLETLGNHPEHIQHWSAPGFVRFVREQARIVSVDTLFPWTLIVGEIG